MGSTQDNSLSDNDGDNEKEDAGGRIRFDMEERRRAWEASQKALKGGTVESIQEDSAEEDYHHIREGSQVLLEVTNISHGTDYHTIYGSLTLPGTRVLLVPLIIDPDAQATAIQIQEQAPGSEFEKVLLNQTHHS